MSSNPYTTTYLEETKKNKRIQLIFRSIITVVLLLLFGGYIVYQAQDWIVGPELVVLRPNDGETFTTSVVLVEGTSTRSIELTINGIKVYSDGAGNFSHELLLAEGIHTLEIVAKNRLGKEKKVTRQIVIK